MTGEDIPFKRQVFLTTRQIWVFFYAESASSKNILIKYKNKAKGGVMVLHLFITTFSISVAIFSEVEINTIYKDYN